MSENTADPAVDTTPENSPESHAEPSEAVEAPDAPGQADSGQESGDPKWRARYRQIETQLVVEQAKSADAARIVTDMQKAEVERLVAVHLQDASDLWRDGITLDQLLGDNGHIDPQLVDEAAQHVKANHPHWARTKPVVGAPATAVNSDGRIPSGATQPTWLDLLSGNKTG